MARDASVLGDATGAVSIEQLWGFGDPANNDEQRWYETEEHDAHPGMRLSYGLRRRAGRSQSLADEIAQTRDFKQRLDQL